MRTAFTKNRIVGEWLRELLKKTTGTPARLMLWLWAVYLLVYILEPINYRRGISYTTMFFLGACVAAFASGSRLFQPNIKGFPAERDPHQPHEIRRAAKLNRLALIFAATGIIGTLLVVIDKVFLSNIDYSQGLGVVRWEMNNEAELSAVQSRSYFLWLGTLTYSFSNVVVLLYMFKGEAFKKLTTSLAVISSICPMVVAVVYGGRTQAILMLALIIGSSLIRLSCNQPVLPNVHSARPVIVGYAVLCLALVIYIFGVRGELYGTSAMMLAASMEVNLDASLSESVQGLVESDSHTSTLLVNGLLSASYVTHGFPELDFLILDNAGAGPYYGQYQLWLINRLLVALQLPVADIRGVIRQDIHHNGLFFTAWGGMLLDFGFWLSPLVVFVLGVGVGWLYKLSVSRNSLNAKLFLAYMYMYILLTPLHSSFSMGNSFLILLSISAASFLLRKESAAGSVLLHHRAGCGFGHASLRGQATELISPNN